MGMRQSRTPPAPEVWSSSAPTANIEVENKNKLIPKNGVYIVKAVIEEEVLYGVMNVGLRPTFADTLSVVIEAHLFEFNKYWYDWYVFSFSL